jgi:hypothetical protein
MKIKRREPIIVRNGSRLRAYKPDHDILLRKRVAPEEVPATVC